MKRRQIYIAMMTWAACGVLVAVMLCARPTTAHTEPASLSWIVSPARAVKLATRDHGAIFLDARGASDFEAGHVSGAGRVDWRSFSRAAPSQRGALLADPSVLAARLRALGVRRDRPVIVVGDPLGGWGEDGRIVWTLRALGHQRAALVDGGHAAMVKAGAPIKRGEGGAIEPGDFRPAPTTRYTIEARALRDSLDQGALLDVREAREYAGKTPCGESRGGHVPRAKHLYYKELIDKSGMLRPRAQIEALLRDHGITTRSERVVAYCTGGVRSAWMVAVLRHLGYERAVNYAGSMWEWSSMPADDFPLVVP